MKLTHKFSYASTLLVFLFGSFSYARLENSDCVKERNNNNVEINSPEIEKLEALREEQQKKFASRQDAINQKRRSGVSKQITKKEQEKLNTDRKKSFIKFGKSMVNARIAAIEIMLKHHQLISELYESMQNDNNNQK